MCVFIMGFVCMCVRVHNGVCVSVCVYNGRDVPVCVHSGVMLKLCTVVSRYMEISIGFHWFAVIAIGSQQHGTTKIATTINVNKSAFF